MKKKSKLTHGTDRHGRRTQVVIRTKREIWP